MNHFLEMKLNQLDDIFLKREYSWNSQNQDVVAKAENIVTTTTSNQADLRSVEY